MALAVIAALLGVFGGGPLSRVHAESGGLAVEYQRFQRASAENHYRFDLDAALVRDGRIRLRLSQALLDDMELESILPEPEAVIAGKDATEFVFRIAGKRTLAETSPFELILLLIISETTQEEMVDGDHSITNAILLIITLTGMSVLLSVAKHYWPKINHVLEGRPLPLVKDGEWLKENLDKSRVDKDEVLAAARMTQGVGREDAIQDATVENDGKISVVPKQPKG